MTVIAIPDHPLNALVTKTLTLPEVSDEEWQTELYGLRDRLVRCCHQVDPNSVDEVLEHEQKIEY